MLGYLPAKFKIRFLEPIDASTSAGLHEDKALVQTVAQEVRARIQENLLRHARQAQVGLVRMSEPWTRAAILVTGLSTYWGGRLAQALEALRRGRGDRSGSTTRSPTCELERTEYVKVGTQHSLLRRVVEAAEIDTVVDTRLVVDSHHDRRAKAHENNVIGTMNILAACIGAGLAGAQGGVQVLRPLLRLRAGRPGLLRRDDGPPAPAAHADRARHRRGRGLASASSPTKNPDVAVTILRFANVLGPDVRTSHIGLFSLPAVPMILGFDPRYQFVHEDDVVHALEHAVKRRCRASTTWPATACWRCSEVAGLLGKPYAPVLPPWGTGLAAAALRRLGRRTSRPRCSTSCASAAALDNRALKAARLRATATRAARPCSSSASTCACTRSCAAAREPYRYEREVEEFLRWSPHVKNAREKSLGSLNRDQLAELQRLVAGYAGAAPATISDDQEQRVQAAERAAEKAVQRAKKAEQRAAESALKATERAKKAERRAGAAAEEAIQRMTAAAELREPPQESPVEHYDDLAAEEVIALLGSLEREDLQTLRDYERRHANRARVLSAIESVLARRETPV